MNDHSTLLARRSFCLLALGSAVALSGCVTQTLEVPIVDHGNIEDQTAKALPIVNALRARHKLPKLVYDPLAVAAAFDQSRLMARVGMMNHNIGPGADFQKRMESHEVGLPAAENIAAEQETVERAVAAWINSPKHLKNMLSDFKGLGVTVSRNPDTGNKPYWSMILSTPNTRIVRR